MGGKYQSRFIYLAMAATAPIAIAAATAPAYAQSAQRNYSIPSQDMGDALRAFALSSGIDVVFDPAVVAGKRSSAVSGSFTGEEALRRLVAGSGLTYRRTPSGGFAITSQIGGRSEAGSAAVDIRDAVSVDQVGQEIVVTGSHIRGSAPAGASLTVLKRTDLENTGRGSLAEAVQTVPQVHGGGANPAVRRSGPGAAGNFFGSSAPNGTATLNLRGLGVEETLTLLNGRRMAPAGYYGAIADISTIPIAAIERVEILADGASATYGADAMAGVVNIIMDRRFEGAETRLRSGIETRSGQPEFQVSQSVGWAFNGGSVLLAADYAHQDGITSAGRPYAASEDLRRFGGSDWRFGNCSPGNIIYPVSLIGAIPPGQDGTTLTSGQIQRGETNRCERWSTSSHIAPETDKWSAYLSSALDITDRLTVDFDLVATTRNTQNVGQYEYGTLAVPASNAFRQMNGLGSDAGTADQDIYISYQFREIDPTKTTGKSASVLGSIGVTYDLFADWQVALAGTYGHYHSREKFRSLDPRSAAQGGALAVALASSDPATAFNPFGEGQTNGRMLVERLFHRYDEVQESSYRNVSLGADGTFIEFPAGAVKLAIGGEYRREAINSKSGIYYPDQQFRFSSNHKFDAARNVLAVYGELFVPIFSERNARPGARNMSISLSGRYDHYADVGGTVNPKMGLDWEPAQGLKISGSYGTSFKAPLLPSLYSPSNAEAVLLQLQGAPDGNGDGLTQALFIGGGNPGLQPEKGKSWTAGIDWAPHTISGLRLRANYFKMAFKGRFADAAFWPLVFSNPSAYQGIAYFPFPSESLARDLIASVDVIYGTLPPPSSVEAIIDTRTLNFASQVIDGVDVGASYGREAFGGTLVLNGDATYLSRYRSRLGQSVTEISYLGNVGLPSRWKARGGLAWTRGGTNLAVSVNHTAGYTNSLEALDQQVAAYTTVDVSIATTLAGKARELLGSNTSLAFYVTNLLDRAPPFVNNPQGAAYDGSNADPFGRRVALQLTKRW